MLRWITGLVVIVLAVFTLWWWTRSPGESAGGMPPERQAASTPLATESPPEEAPRPTAPEEGVGTLEVEILTDASLTPVRGGIVSVLPNLPDDFTSGDYLPDEITAFTDRRGIASLELPSRGRHGVVITLPTRFFREEHTIELAAGSTRKLQVLVTEGGVVEGRILDPRGDPVAGALVRLVRIHLFGGLAGIRAGGRPVLERLLQLGSQRGTRGILADTDERGAFQLVGIPASVPLAALGQPETGSWAVVATHPDYAPIVRPIAVASDEPVRFEARFEGPGWPVHGSVLDPAGQPVRAFVHVRIHLGEEALLHSVRSDELGLWKLPPVLDERRVTAVRATSLEPRVGQATELRGEADGRPIVLALSPEDMAEVSCFDPQGKPLAGAGVRVQIHVDGLASGELFTRNLPATFLLPDPNSPLSLDGGVHPPSGYRCLQQEEGLLRTAYPLDPAVLFGGAASFTFELGSNEEAALEMLERQRQR